MGTHDEDTRKFFANTRVNCELFAREGAHAQDSIVGRNTTDRIFTHHQKTVCSVPGQVVLHLLVSQCHQRRLPRWGSTGMTLSYTVRWTAAWHLKPARMHSGYDSSSAVTQALLESYRFWWIRSRTRAATTRRAHAC